MNDKQIHEQPSAVAAENGDVLVKGPDAVDVALTPDAALETSDRLLEGAMNARGQTYFAYRRKGGSPADR